MTTTTVTNKIVDPSICSCFPDSYRRTIFEKVKWSTLSICAALLIIIVYLSSGLHALIDITTMTSTQSFTSGSVFWTLATSPLMHIYGWVLISIYFAVVLLVIVLLCGVQLEKPWLLFLWSVFMVFMLLADGIVTVLSLREHQHQNYRPLNQIKILFFLMNIRLIISLCGIFITIFHFRCLYKAQGDQKNRQRMLERYNIESPTSSYHDSTGQSAAALNPLKTSTNSDCYLGEFLPPVALPRVKVANMHQYPASAISHTYNHQSEYIMHSYHRAINRHNNDFRYNVPLQERFHAQENTGLHNF